MIKKAWKNVLMLAFAIALLAGARVAWAEPPQMEDVVCCTGGPDCQAGEACCRRKNVAPCSQSRPMECVSNPNDCVPEG